MNETRYITGRGARAAALAAALLLAGCDFFGYTSIKEIQSAPGQFEGKEVKIKGKAVSTSSMLGMKSFTVKDDTGEISVTTEGQLPAENSDVAVKGTVKSAMIMGGRSMGLRLEEKERLR